MNMNEDDMKKRIIGLMNDPMSLSYNDKGATLYDSENTEGIILHYIDVTTDGYVFRNRINNKSVFIPVSETPEFAARLEKCVDDWINLQTGRLLMLEDYRKDIESQHCNSEAYMQNG